MKYIIHYWCAHWPELTGFEQGEVITEEQLLTLIREAKVNIMIHHGDEEHSVCFIDDLNNHFQQR